MSRTDDVFTDDDTANAEDRMRQAAAADRQVSETPDPLNEAWKELIATALRRNAVVAVGEHRAAVEAAVLAARPSPAEPPHDLRSRWPGNTGPMWCHTHNLPAAHAISAEPPAGDLRREDGIAAIVSTLNDEAQREVCSDCYGLVMRNGHRPEDHGQVVDLDSAIGAVRLAAALRDPAPARSRGA